MTSSSPFSGNHHTCITTPDIARLKDFYCRFFGFDVLTEMQWEAGNALADAICSLRDTAVKMVLWRLNNACLEIFEFIQTMGKAGDPMRPVCDAGYTHICISVNDIDAAYKR